MEEKVESVQGNILRQMFPWQTELINEYVKLDSLPHHPLDDLNSKQNQRTLKEFINNFIEELSEAYQELVMMLDHIEKNEKSQAKEHLIKYNEEIADAWHFFLEFLVYADYREDKLDMLSKNFCDATSFPYHEDRPFTTLLGIGSFTNKAVQRGIFYGTPFRIVDENEALANFQVAGGRRIDQDILKEHRDLLWAITHVGNLLKNTLKNRAWTQTERTINIVHFEEKLFQLCLVWATYMEFAGFTQSNIVQNYHRKALINIKRIRDGY